MKKKDAQTDYDKFKKKHPRLLQEEETILLVTEALHMMAKKKRRARKDLACIAGLSEKRYSEIMDDNWKSADVTIREFSAICFALSHEPEIYVHAKAKASKRVGQIPWHKAYITGDNR